MYCASEKWWFWRVEMRFFTRENDLKMMNHKKVRSFLYFYCKTRFNRWIYHAEMKPKSVYYELYSVCYCQSSCERYEHTCSYYNNCHHNFNNNHSQYNFSHNISFDYTNRSFSRKIKILTFSSILNYLLFNTDYHDHHRNIRLHCFMHAHCSTRIQFQK